MSGKPSKSASPDRQTKSAKPRDPTPPGRGDSLRETIETIVFALVLAFLFRTFEAQAYEIPTGSMGPTLMGRHKDLICPACGFHYRVGASMEVYSDTGTPRPGNRVTGATCPLCRFQMSIDGREGDPQENPSYSGDRIWVTRAPYVSGDPERFDVAVFRKPEVSEENYIKRLVGLPNETLRIRHGDLFARDRRHDQFTIVRRPPRKIFSSWLPVYDTDNPCSKLIEAGWPSRWQADTSVDRSQQGGWTSSNDLREFTSDGSLPGGAWLRYWHLVPTRDDWRAVMRGPLPPDYAFPRPQLVTDFCAYNSAMTVSSEARTEPDRLGVDFLGTHWVGDLAIQAELDLHGTAGTVTLELVEGGRRLQCKFDAATGAATLAIEGLDSFQPSAATGVKGPGTYHVTLANFDDRLLLWVDGKRVAFDGPTSYEPLGNGRPTEADLSPVGIGTQGANVTLRHLRIMRDIYYIAVYQHGEGMLTDQIRNPYLFPHITREKLARFMSTPGWWKAFDDLATIDYELGEGEYLALGDNSPNSGDGRFWAARGAGAVRREQVLGKAFFTYWPHAWPTRHHLTLNVRNKVVRVPFYPDFRRMRWIH